VLTAFTYLLRPEQCPCFFWLIETIFHFHKNVSISFPVPWINTWSVLKKCLKMYVREMKWVCNSGYHTVKNFVLCTLPGIVRRVKPKHYSGLGIWLRWGRQEVNTEFCSKNFFRNIHLEQFFATSVLPQGFMCATHFYKKLHIHML
jgi:hypothetical protein